MQEYNHYLLGADPEFEVVDTHGHVVSAAEYISGGTEDEVGVDGASCTGELRVVAGSPITVLNSLRKNLVALASELPQGFTVKAGSGTRFPLGGHIHFSDDIRPSPSLLQSLDKFISKPLNKVSNTERRRDSSYGRMGAVHSNEHGWEYRTPLSWICHPLIAKGVLVLSEYLGKQAKRHKGLPSSRVGLRRAIRGEKELEKPIAQFFELLALLHKGGITLESLEVFKSWGVSKDYLVKSSCNVTYSRDALLAGLPSPRLPKPLRVTGAGNSRTPFGERVVFVPWRFYTDRLKLGLAHSGINLLPWNSSPAAESRELQSIVGLSYPLRQGRERCVAGLELIFAEIARIQSQEVREARKQKKEERV